MTTRYTRFIRSLGNNEESDECYTPVDKISPLYPFIDINKTYYEATSGKSNSIVSQMVNDGYKIKSSGDKDFFDCKSEDIYDGIITNPPYSKKDLFISKCYELGKPFALLLPVAAMQGQRRGKLFKEKGISLLVYNKRIDFTGNKSPTFGVAWFMGNGFCEPNKIWFH